MITKLTEEQNAKIPEYRERYFRQAVSTEPADRARAEKAVRRLAEIAGYEIGSVTWRNSPEECASLIDSIWNSLSDPLWSSLEYPLWSSLEYPLWNSLWGPLSVSLWSSLKGSLRDSLRNSLWNSIRGPLRDSLKDSVGGSLRDSLSYSLWNSLRYTDWVCLSTFAVKELDIKISDNHRELLHQYNEIAASCFAVWVAPGRAIFCERPASVEIKDGNLVGLNWRKKVCKDRPRKKKELECLRLPGGAFILVYDALRTEYLKWDGGISSVGERIAVFHTASDAIYFAGLHEWTVRKGVIR